MLTAFIDDGYTRAAYFKPVEELRPAVRFTYRPALVAERDEILYGPASKGSATVQAMAVAKMIVSKVKSWDISDQKGQPVAITEGNVIRLEPSLFDRMLQVVLGTGVPDRDPDAGKDEADKLAKAEYELAMQGSAAGAVAEGEAAKN
jgi:hypothetical protein